MTRASAVGRCDRAMVARLVTNPCGSRSPLQPPNLHFLPCEGGASVVSYLSPSDLRRLVQAARKVGRR